MHFSIIHNVSPRCLYIYFDVRHYRKSDDFWVTYITSSACGLTEDSIDKKYYKEVLPTHQWDPVYDR